MSDKNKFGNSAETTASDLPAELVKQLEGKSADKTPVLSKRPDTKNPPTESGEYRLTQNLKSDLNQKLTKVFDPRARQVIQRQEIAEKVLDRDELYSDNDVFSEIEKERDEISKKFPRTPAPEKGKDTDYPREADTDRPPAGNTPRPGFSTPSTLEELKAEEERQLQEAKKQDTTPTPVPDRKSPIPNGNHRKVSGQYKAQNIYGDAEFSGTARFASPKLPNLQRRDQPTEKPEEPADQTKDTIIDLINKNLKP